MKSLSEKVAIVTGGGSGIGEGLCRELARRGARVVVADINSGAAGRVAQSINGAITRDGGQATASTVDVSRAEEVTRLTEETAAAHGRLDYMFNNAGFAIGGAPAKMMEPERAARVILDGVARNKALIVFPASIRWARRADRLFPGFSNKILLRQMRELRRYRTADERVPG